VQGLDLIKIRWNVRNMNKDAEKLIFTALIQINAPFAYSFNIFGLKIPDLWGRAYADVYPSKIILKWGAIRKNEKEIQLLDIVSFELEHVDALIPAKLSMDEWRTKIICKDNGETACLEMMPTKFSLLEYPKLIKHLREKIPNKEQH